MTAQTYTVNGASDLLEKDRRLIGRVLKNIPPDSKAGGKATWRIPTIVNALIADAESRGVSAPGLTEARTRVATARAETAEFENEKTKGDWVKLSVATEWMIRDTLVVKERLLCLSGELSEAFDAAQREEVEDKVRQALTELSNIKSFMKLDKRYNAEARAEIEYKKIMDVGDDANA
jgi:hypothetical protein